MQGLPDPDLSLPLFGLLWLGLELDLAGGVLGRPRAYDLVKAYYHQAVFLTEGFAGSLVAHLVRVVDERTPAATRPGAQACCTPNGSQASAPRPQSSTTAKTSSSGNGSTAAGRPACSPPPAAPPACRPWDRTPSRPAGRRWSKPAPWPARAKSTCRTRWPRPWGTRPSSTWCGTTRTGSTAGPQAYRRWWSTTATTAPPQVWDYLRRAERLAAGLRAVWFAVYIEDLADLPAEERNQAIRHLQLAQQLGAETIALTDHGVTREVIAFARAHNVNRIIIGKPLRRSLHERLLGSLVDRIIHESDNIDVQIIRPRGTEPPARPAQASPTLKRRSQREWATATQLAFLTRWRLEQNNLIMIYLLGVTVTSMRCGRWPALAGSVLAVAVFDFFFVPPFFTFAVSDTQYLVTFAVMLAVDLVISTLTTRLRELAEAARVLQRRSEIMHHLSAQLARQCGAHNLLAVTARQIGELFESEVTSLLPDDRGQLVVAANQEGDSSPADAKNRGVIQWAYDLGQSVGWGTENLPYCQLPGPLYAPVGGGEAGRRAAMQVRPQDSAFLFSPEQTRLLSSLAGQLVLALEVERLEQSALRARLEGKIERTRSSLLISVATHDFQTPLAAVMGSASSIMEMGLDLPRPAMLELAENIYDEAERLSRLMINNLPRVTRLQSDALALQRELQPLEEVVGAAFNRLERIMTGRELTIDLPATLPLLYLDSPLMEQLFINLLKNALKYPPEGSPLRLRAWARQDSLEVELADQRPGASQPEEERERTFDLFRRGDREDDSRATA